VQYNSLKMQIRMISNDGEDNDKSYENSRNWNRDEIAGL
jgi:hypothetical protein